MDRSLTDKEREILARKEARRAKDREDVAAGRSTAAEVNRANAWATSVIAEYRPNKTLGLKR